MGSILSFEVVGGEAVQKGLAVLQSAIEDLTPFWREVFAPKYFGVVSDLFATSGTPRGEGGRFSGGPWQRLSPAYAVWKARNYPGKPILTRTGALRESMRWGGSAPGAGGLFEATPTYAIAGTTVPYGRYHQSGTSKMPARPFMPQPDPAVFAPLMLKWIMKAHASAK